MESHKLKQKAQQLFHHGENVTATLVEHLRTNFE